MYRFLKTSLAMLLGSILVGCLIIFNFSLFAKQQVIVLTILLLLIIISRHKKQLSLLLMKRDIYPVLFLSTMLSQLIVISTGGVISPFFMVLNFYALTLSFLMGFSVGAAFLVFSTIVLLASTLTNGELLAALIINPGPFLLSFVSLFLVLPIAYEMNYRYRLKDKILGGLREQLRTQQSIFAGLHEMVFITNTQFQILSVNEAVNNMLHKSPSELVDKKLFDVLFLKDERGKLIDSSVIPKDVTSLQSSPLILNNIRLVSVGSAPLRQVTVKIRAVSSMDGRVNTLSVIINDTAAKTEDIRSVHKNIELTNVKHVALIDELKTSLRQQGKTADYLKLLLIEKIELDILTARSLQDHIPQLVPGYVDIAKLCQNMCLSQQDFAKELGVNLQFAFQNFGAEDVKQLTAGEYHVSSPNELTGPFFTVKCDSKWVELLIQNVLDIALFLSRTSPARSVSMQLVREDNNNFRIEFVTASRMFSADEKNMLFEEYYGKLPEREWLLMGSGLEGYLVKQITELMNLPLHIVHNEQEGTNIFSLHFTRNASA